MVEREIYLNNLFGSLADPIRRDMLQRLIAASFTVGQLAEKYNVSFAAISKHINVLVKANLVTKKRHGKEQIVSIAPGALQDASQYLARYEALWAGRFDNLEKVIKGEL
jgi:DNA-binding transcriptional ArsR family regulator